MISGDIIEDSSLYNKLQGAEGWDANNDITVAGNKYHRMTQSDATYIGESYIDAYYDWSDSDVWHYFKYEPIKWRVLEVKGNQVFLLSDIVLDNQMYNTEYGSKDITWETSTIRSWMNGYRASFNKEGKDYSSKNFIGGAFSEQEREAIKETNVVNADNISYGTEGGNDTTDKIFLLSESEVDGDSAEQYGFSNSMYDEARRGKSSTYAKAMGTYTNLSDARKGNCVWWLRSPGSHAYYATDIGDDGYVNNNGGNVHSYADGVRVALNLDLSLNLHTYAGTVSSEREGSETDAGSNGDVGDGGSNGTSEGSGSSGSANLPAESGQPVKVSKITLSGMAQQIAAGKKIKLTANITPSNASNKTVTWKSSNKKVATVNSSGVVTMKKKSGGKTVTITATAKDGSGVKATYKIKSMKGASCIIQV